MITTHVLDTTQGRPAAGIPVTLDVHACGEAWTELGKTVTDKDGRARALVASSTELQAGLYRLTFDVESYQVGFYPRIVIVFRVETPSEHYHVPVLLSKFGYTTYRGS
jgi:5-hydroxyisourate hydrolase